MALQTATGTITVPGSTGSSSTTGLGFAPKFLLFFYNMTTADGSIANNNYGVGCADYNTNQWSQSFASTDGATPNNDSGNGSSTTIAIKLYDSTPTLQYSGTVTSLDSDGFTINWTTVLSGVQVHYFAIGGSSMDVKVGSTAKATVTGNQAYTGVGWTPSGGLFFNDRNKIGNSSGVHAYFGVGAAQSSSARWAAFWTKQDGTASARGSSYQRTVEVENIQTSGGGAPIDIADFVSFDSDGFTFNWTTNSGSVVATKYAVFRGVQISVGSFSQKTSTGTLATTGIGFQPKALILTGWNLAANTSAQNFSRFSFGVATSTSSRRCIWGGSKNAVPPTVDSQDTDTTKIIKHMTENSGSPTTQAAADLSSFDSDGFTLNWTTADATARQILYLAIGQVTESDGKMFQVF